MKNRTPNGSEALRRKQRLEISVNHLSIIFQTTESQSCYLVPKNGTLCDIDISLVRLNEVGIKI